MSAIAVVPHTSDSEFAAGAVADLPSPLAARAVACPFQIVVRVEGEVDATIIDALGYALRYAANRARHAVIVDLCDASFLSIRAAGTLASAKRTCDAAGVEMHLVAGPRRVERVLELAGVRLLFRFHPSVRDALRA